MYQLFADNPNAVLRLADGAGIPKDPDNIDWQAYQAWLDDGNTPLPATVVAPVTPPPSPLKVLADLLVSKNLVTQADLTLAAQEAGVTFSQNAEEG